MMQRERENPRHYPSLWDLLHALPAFQHRIGGRTLPLRAAGLNYGLTSERIEPRNKMINHL